MSTTLRKCLDCGRLFAAREGVQQCQNCNADERSVYKRIEDAVVLDHLTTVPGIADELGVDTALVRRVLADMPSLANLVENDEFCMRCGIRPATIGRDYCSNCIMELNADLREMAAISQRSGPSRAAGREAPAIRMSVGKALREKQRRTGHYRFNPAPPNIKGS